MCDDNLNNGHVCSCANHNLPTYEEAVGAAVTRVEPSEIHTIFTTPKLETDHDRQSSTPSIDSSRSRNTNNTHRSSYRTHNDYRNPSCNRTRYSPAGNTLSSANDSGAGIESQKSNTPCGSSVAIVAFFVAVLFIIIFLIMKGYAYLRHSFIAIETSSGD